MNHKYKYLSKNVLLFSLSNIGSKIIIFLLIPLYTSCLTTSEYGIGDIILTAATLTVPIITVCIASAVLRYCFDKEYAQIDVFIESIKVSFKGFVICAVLALAVYVAPFIDISVSFLFAYLMIVISQSLYEIVVNYARGCEKVEVFVEVSVINTILTCTLNIFLLAVMKRGLDGYLFSNYTAGLISSVWGIIRTGIIKDLKKHKTNNKLGTELKHYSFPLIFNKIGWWINSSSDRFIVIWLLGAAANGVYTVSYKIPTILDTFSGIFSQAWQLSAIKEFDKKDSDGFVSNLYNLYNSFLVMLCSILIVASIPIAKVLYAKEFFDAWKYVPPLLIASVFGALSGFFGSIFVSVKDTKIFTYSTLIGGAINIVLNIVIMFLWKSAMGAAIATLISNVVVWAIRFKRSQKYISLRIPVVQDVLMYLLLVCQFLICLQGIKSEFVFFQLCILCLLLILNRKEFVSILRKAQAVIKSKIASKP